MSLTAAQRVRLYVADPLNEEGSDDGSFFSDEEILDLLEQANSSLNLAAYLGWAMKAAQYAELVDITESGSTRSLSQKHRQAVLQMKHFYDVAARDESQLLLNTRVVGKVASILSRTGETVLTNEFIGPEPTQVRQYPTHRFISPSTLG